MQGEKLKLLLSWEDETVKASYVVLSLQWNQPYGRYEQTYGEWYHATADTDARALSELALLALREMGAGDE
jgi:hypothetical protein